MVGAFILDFDGLILDTETPLIDAWSHVHTCHGFVFDRSLGHQVIGHSGVEFDPWATFPTASDRALLEREFQDCLEDLIARQTVLPGISALITEAAHQGIALGVASNSHHRHVDHHLQRLGLLDRFATVACRDDVTWPKPAPDVYLHACAALGVAPGAAVAFEDSGPGHLAAHAAGLTVVVIPNPSTRHGTFPHASLRLDSAAEMPAPALIARLRDTVTA